MAYLAEIQLQPLLAQLIEQHPWAAEALQARFESLLQETVDEPSRWGCVKSRSSSDFARTKVHLEHPKALYILPNDLKMTF